MKRIVALISAFLIAACDYGVEWRDKPYEVIWIDTGKNRTLNFELSDGVSIGRVEAEVIAVGSNKIYVVAASRVPGTEIVAYYYIERAKDSIHSEAEDVTHGPFTEEQFNELKRNLALPGFTEHF